MRKTCVVVGAGHAGAQFVTSLRQQGWDDDILLLGEEPALPYHRPPLSKAFLAGEATLDEILLRPAGAYDQAGVQCLTGARVTALDAGQRQLTLADGATLDYDKLCLATGSRPRRVDLPGATLDGICYLRNLQDAERIREHIHPGGHAVIVGGGYIGLEVAAVLNRAGMQVTVLEMAPRVLQRVTAPAVSDFYTRVHQEEGVAIRCGVAVSGFSGGERVQQVQCADGGVYPADLVVIGVGIVPNQEIAAAAGLDTGDGIIVDACARSSDPDIVAAGDCTYHYNPVYDRWLRLESVQNAVDQARVAAAAVCGQETPYHALPWFWSDQYDIKLQIAGLSAGYDDLVLRGTAGDGRSFAVFYLRQGRVIAVDAVNRAAEFMLGKRLITGQTAVDARRLADPGLHPRELLAG